MRSTTLSALVLGCFALSAPLAGAQSESESAWSQAPGPITPAEVALLADARASLDQAGVSLTLIDPRFAPLHPRTEFREAVRDRADARPLTIAPPDEPGERLEASVLVRGGDGAPVRAALVYLYQTSAKGWYAADGAHVRANSGDHKHARLFGYARTNDAGAIELRTVRPGGYPRSTLPQHVHVAIEAPGFAPLHTELLFDDDPRLTEVVRKEAASNGFAIAKPQRAENGAWRASYELTMRPSR